MPRAIFRLLNIVWALWFGGVVVLFIAVQSLFATFADRHDVAGLAATGIFHRFGVFQLLLAGASLLLTSLCRRPGGRRESLAFPVLLGLATGVSILLTVVVAPRIDVLREQNLTHSPEFGRLHGISMTLFLAEAFVLLCAGFIMPTAPSARR